MDLAIGTVLAGRYVLTRQLAQGGVSTVYQAVDAAAGRRLAVKVVDEHYCGWIRHEAAMTERLRHPHVPKFFDAAVVPLADGRAVGYLAMELLHGEALTLTLDRGPVPWADAAQVAGTAADVLTVAHRRGVVHRDLSPANVMLTPGGPKIVDFGLAGLINTTSQPADDVYALGTLLYRMLTGRAAALRWLSPAPVLAVPGLPRQLAELTRACMAKRAASRPTARETSLLLWGLLG